jgi:predicted RNA-binding Zn-ribbon protein involved in translation (DUF1610 family)
VKENAHDLCIGDGDSDGKNEIYAGTSNKQVYEVFFNTTIGRWDSLAAGSGNAAINGVAIGAPRGDPRTLEVVAASGDGHGYEFFNDRVPPPNPQLWSDTHPVPGTWYDKNVVHVLWKDVGYDISGIDGYSVAWDRSAGTVPGETKTYEEDVHDAYSPALPDGNDWYFHIRARDNALNWNLSATSFGPIMIDTTPPDYAKVVINNDDAYTNSELVTLSVTATDPSPGSGVAKMAFSNDGAAWSPWEGFAPSRSGWSLTDSRYGGSDSDGTRTVSAKVMDGLGHEIAAGNRGSDSIFLDRAAPAGLSGIINGGAAYTTSPDVTLALGAQDPEPASGLWKMQLSNDGATWSDLTDWSVQASWSLTAGAGGSDSDGNRSVYLRVEDRAGNTGGPASASIFLDRGAPQNLSITINDGADYANVSTVEVAIQATDPVPGSLVSDMTLANAEGSLGTWETFENSKTGWDLTSGAGGTDTDGNKTVYLKVRDRAGNVAGPATASVFLDRVKPGALSVLINGGATYTTGRKVGLTLGATDPEPASGVSAMQFSDDGSSWTPFEPYSVQRNYTLPAPDGLKTVFFRVWDRAGNAGDTVSASIILDTASPVISSVRVGGITDRSAVITWTTDEEADSGVDYGLTVDYGTSGLDPGLLTSHSVALGNLTPSTTYHFRVHSKDRAGNAPAYSGDYLFITAATPDTVPPEISDLQVSGITDRLAVVSWATNEPADSDVHYGLNTYYGQGGSDGNFVLIHSIVLRGLLPDTTYHFMVLSTDPSGNGPAKSGDRNFTTLRTPDVTPPVISNVKVSGVTDSLALVTWETDEPADGVVYFGTTTAYGRSAGHAGLLTLHELTLAGLVANTTYHFRVECRDGSGNGPSSSGDYSFTTAGGPDTTPPSIFNLRVEGISETGATVMWETDEVADGAVEYGLTSSYGLSSANPGYSVQHSVLLQGFAPGTTYHFRARSADASGNAQTGSDGTFRTKKKGTPPDTTAPAISGLEVTGITDTHAVVLWQTDEPADSQAEYGNTTLYGLRASDPAHILVHSIVLDGLKPSTGYHLRVSSTDVYGNGPALGPDVYFVTGATPDTVPPVIGDVKVSGLTNTSATISWRTDEPADSRIEYGPNISYGLGLRSQSCLYDHSIVITGLSPGTAYHFRVSSVDPSANPSNPSADMKFTTLKIYIPPGSGPAPTPGAVTSGGSWWPWAALALAIAVAAAAGVGYRSRKRRKAVSPVESQEPETVEMAPAVIPSSLITGGVSPAAEVVEVLPMEPAQEPPVSGPAPHSVPAPAPTPKTPVKHIRCPACKTRLPIYNDVPQQIVCPNCGKRGPYRPKGGTPAASTSTGGAELAAPGHHPASVLLAPRKPPAARGRPPASVPPGPHRPPAAALEAGPRMIRCSGCGSRVTVHATVFPIRVTCPNCGKSGMYRGPKNG